VDRNEKMTVNRLILGDNLEILKSMESGMADMIYLDPPFYLPEMYFTIFSLSNMPFSW
jgi:site-specific DNA-methyltransferase (adenine-specific)